MNGGQTYVPEKFLLNDIKISIPEKGEVAWLMRAKDIPFLRVTSAMEQNSTIYNVCLEVSLTK